MRSNCATRQNQLQNNLWKVEIESDLESLLKGAYFKKCLGKSVAF